MHSRRRLEYKRSELPHIRFLVLLARAKAIVTPRSECQRHKAKAREVATAQIQICSLVRSSHWQVVLCWPATKRERTCRDLR